MNVGRYFRDPRKASDREENVDDNREKKDGEAESNDSRASDDESDDIDDDDCNARPCIIDNIVSKSKDHVDWIQCRLRPKWYHAYCINVNEDVAHLFECDKH